MFRQGSTYLYSGSVKMVGGSDCEFLCIAINFTDAVEKVYKHFKTDLDTVLEIKLVRPIGLFQIIS